MRIAGMAARQAAKLQQRGGAQGAQQCHCRGAEGGLLFEEPQSHEASFPLFLAV